MTEWTSETAEWYATKYGEYATNRLALDRLTLDEEMTIIDLGCGTGAALRHASLTVKEGVLLGVDPVPRMIEIAQERLASHPHAARITFHVGHVHELPVEDSCADLVLAFDSYHHWGAHTHLGLGEVVRVLAPTGQFIIVKDASMPAKEGSRAALLADLRAAGLHVRDTLDVEEQDVAFTMWICTSTT
jgi:ubiquinone/menaquinone biosynthesis C-methylase UbiE